MAGNTFGCLYRVTTWGESHGPALGAVIDGCPPGLSLNEKDIQRELDRRKPGQSAVGTSRLEEDRVRILSGVFEGKTTGTPISLMIENRDHRSEDYGKIKDLYRPGHADLAWDLKFGCRDYRGGGRSSGRETAARVMAGAIAKKYLRLKARTEIFGYSVQIGPVKARQFDHGANVSGTNVSRWSGTGGSSGKVDRTIDRGVIEKNAVRCPDAAAAKKMEKYIFDLKSRGDSAGGIAEFVVKNPPAALGEPVFDKLQADLGKALFSIGTVKGVEFGRGFEVAILKGSENNDRPVRRAGKILTATNNAGGIFGGISIGTDIIIRVAAKPASSILKEQKTVDKKGRAAALKVEGRHDACILPRLIPVAESMIAITLMDHFLRQKAVR